MKLDILSDPICPWCYIGKAHLDRAFAARPNHPFVVEWHPFQLNPAMPEGGMDRTVYLEAKFGGRDNAARTYARISDAADEAGLQIDFEKIERTPNTLDAHRLIHWAGLEGRQTAMVSTLFRAYFREGADLEQRQTLVDLATSVGLDGGMIERLFDTEADVEEIRARDAHARERGIKGVPMFVVGERHAVSGAQATQLWTDVIDELVGREA
ncbi:DsbA family oxidoreductase [Roseitranquillus sediminis]|uniref:DsbA family oxidoreductase n=1 Tax=Roseitranquillus sediminis TaxID=2809051 RepID=UPI001D0C7033|nr:DsbA family oxidoreductase [Roseitranquillus sediminis]MBM9595592.1 DsbA family oxidoreductase [Roseitranquillus sediminis]